MNRLTIGDRIAVTLVIIGGINWGLVGMFERNVIEAITGGGEANMVARVIYVFVGLAAVYLIYTVSRMSAVPKEPSGGRGEQV